jgi:hypothetical protein
LKVRDAIAQLEKLPQDGELLVYADAKFQAQVPKFFTIKNLTAVLKELAKPRPMTEADWAEFTEVKPTKLKGKGFGGKKLKKEEELPF